jgi:hypothetical protein
LATVKRAPPRRRVRNPETYAELDKKITPALGPGRNWRASMAQDVIERRRTEIWTRAL